MLRVIGLIAGVSKKNFITKLGNSNWPTIGKIPLHGSQEGLVNTMVYKRKIFHTLFKEKLVIKKSVVQRQFH